MPGVSLATFLLMEAAVIAASYGLAAAALRGDRGFFHRPLLAGGLASVLINAWVAWTDGLDAFLLISLATGFAYGLAGGAFAELVRRLWAGRRR